MLAADVKNVSLPDDHPVAGTRGATCWPHRRPLFPVTAEGWDRDSLKTRWTGTRPRPGPAAFPSSRPRFGFLVPVSTHTHPAPSPWTVDEKHAPSNSSFQAAKHRGSLARAPRRPPAQTHGQWPWLRLLRPPPHTLLSPSRPPEAQFSTPPRSFPCSQAGRQDRGHHSSGSVAAARASAPDETHACPPWPCPPRTQRSCPHAPGHPDLPQAEAARSPCSEVPSPLTHRRHSARDRGS